MQKNERGFIVVVVLFPLISKTNFSSAETPRKTRWEASSDALRATRRASDSVDRRSPVDKNIEQTKAIGASTKIVAFLYFELLRPVDQQVQRAFGRLAFRLERRRAVSPCDDRFRHVQKDFR